MDMRRYLVVANQTVGGEHLVEKVRECLEDGSCGFHLVVPATPPQEHMTWTEGAAHAIAQDRLDRALARMRQLGADADGEVGDPNPMLAIEDALLGQSFDAIILSTLPPGASRWLKKDLPHRVEARFHLPVIHVIGEPESATPPGSSN
jgi:hypothetical protein